MSEKLHGVKTSAAGTDMHGEFSRVPADALGIECQSFAALLSTASMHLYIGVQAYSPKHGA